MAKSKAEIQADYEKRTGYEAQKRYHKTGTTNLSIRLINTTDADVITWLNEQPNKAGYIKSLISADMEAQKGTE